ncbi:MAG: fluoride efflux transporter CrcB [Pseudomonadota bacterium]
MMGLGTLGWVAAGGAAGASARYLTTQLMQGWLGRSFPWGTLTVNVLGSFLIGLAVVWISTLDPETRGAQARLLLITGLLGGFTTFSAFSLETLTLAEQGFVGRAAVNVVANVFTCLAAVFAGVALARPWSA